MSKFVKIIATLALLASPLMSQAATATDPIVEARTEINAAEKAKSAEVKAARKEYREAKAKAKAELTTEKKENAVKAKAAAAEGKDPLVVKRELDAQSTAVYKEKVKVADEKFSAMKKASKSKMTEKKVEVTEKMGKSGAK
jgi:hypothetical protein